MGFGLGEVSLGQLGTLALSLASLGLGILICEEWAPALCGASVSRCVEGPGT